METVEKNRNVGILLRFAPDMTQNIIVGRGGGVGRVPTVLEITKNIMVGREGGLSLS